MIASLLPIEGQKILIGALEEADLEDLYNLEIDKDVKRYVGGPTAHSKPEWIEEMRKHINNSQAYVLPLIVRYKATGEFAGRAGLSLKDREERCREIQVLIAKKYWGQRLGKEAAELLIDVAFGAFEASAVVAMIHPDNKASLNLFEELGFFAPEGNHYAGIWPLNSDLLRVLPAKGACIAAAKSGKT
jgi:RimJ/RimL family protein N-acetyltransferase